MKISKLVNSRDTWKRKAKRRGSAIRGFQKTANAHKKRQAQDVRKIRRLEAEVAELRIALDARRCPMESAFAIQYRTLCVLIVVCGIVSFRSVPRILQVFQPLLRAKDGPNSAFHIGDPLDLARCNRHLLGALEN